MIALNKIEILNLYEVIILKFEDLGLCKEILSSIKNIGYREPTAIQKKAIPNILIGRDILGCAQTGTGKTGSFIMPLIEILNSGKSKSRMPRSLILTPTRELAIQAVSYTHLRAHET